MNIKMNDNYTHSDNKVIYVVENILGPLENSVEYEEVVNNLNSQIINHCQCGETCTSSCTCIQSSGGLNFVNTENQAGKRLNEAKDFKIYSIQECNSLCKCSSYCGNRLVQHGPIENLVIKTCERTSKGFGLYTEIAIPRRTFICEYAGEVITKTQALLRHNSNSLERKMNYIYCLNEHCSGKTIQTFIDPSEFGNIGRYMNHSCEPNCVIIPVRVDTITPKLAIFSCRDVLPNTELTFDYGSHNLENKSVIISDEKCNRTKCLCDSEKCRKWMPFDVY